MERMKAETSAFIAPYVVACYDESRFCDLVLVCDGNRDGFISRVTNSDMKFDFTKV